ncbi:MAG: Ldh family oxidoreductase [Alphaproteobacteria bacterium]
MVKVTLNEIEQSTKKGLLAHGADEWVAQEMATTICKAESIGNRICGLFYYESYCQQLVSGRVKGDVQPVVSNPKPSVISVDAKYGFAQTAFLKGMPTAIEKARENGVATLAICHSHTATSMGYFTRQIAEQGLIALGMTNASPCVAAPGGKTPVIGTNPVSFAVPDGKGGVAMLFDQSTTAVAKGKLSLAKAAGEDIPIGWALDKDGNQTTDPSAGLDGTLESSGGYKGWGLGLMVEMLAAGMTGSIISRDVSPLKDVEGPHHDLGQFYLIIDPSAQPEFFNRLSQIQDGMKADKGTRMPGSSYNPANEIEVPDAMWDKVKELETKV